MTLKQACPLEYQRAQCAFKDSMIHEYLQFILLIAFRCVLHRCENQEIRCWKFWLLNNRLTLNKIWLSLISGRPHIEGLPKQSFQKEKNTCVRKNAVKHFSFCNDPSAGSPTETLLRLLLPLNDQVWLASRFQDGVAPFSKPIRKPH